jgi:prepilin-type N-terminal cleavage/methylation domain-containing protein
MRTNRPFLEAGPRRGFTIVEVIMAMMIMTIAILALASTSGAVSRMLTRGHNAEIAAGFGARRLDLLRITACTSQAAGADTLFRGGPAWAAVNSWTFTSATNNTWQIRIATSYRSGSTIASDVTETSISCVF